jgi:uncharacterized phage protein (TIGR01671 family)
MREIKFRAAYDGRVYPVSELMWSDRTAYLVRDGDHENLVSMDEIELLQFTGLLDKKGTEIYEGDVVSFSSKNHSTKSIGVIKWDEEDLQWRETSINERVSSALMPDFPGRICEVIVNIYENPELLK